MKNTNALIMVDLQKDFCGGGSLAVPDADAVIPLANELQKHFDLVIATKDWHPADHTSFAANHPEKKVNEIILLGNIKQILWPNHCVQETNGAKFHTNLAIAAIDKIILKGTNKDIDSYSAFFDNAHLKETELRNYLREHQITDIFVMGLATDYCVKYSCLDAVKLGFKTHIIEDACRGVELSQGDIAKALKEMQEEGVQVIQCKDIFAFSSF